MRVRKLSQDRPWTFLVGATILKPLLIPLASRTWIDGDKIPATGGCIVVANHISHLDPLTMAHFVYDHGRVPRYLAKSSLFTQQAARRLPQVGGPDPRRAPEPQRRRCLRRRRRMR